ncbi:YD repeat-containing protein [Pedobacter sp. AK013]|uniref:hypothetical protein n=1 Tax=Pedobacter sp. AK013 TaxID=2723071 RepID=UPI0016084A5E|nr:hypothetical protein [Pedobacter sp. AK013]MBB6240540.1 YD repeat-containing protein [Pedobacter sp. AK013]
MKRILTLLSILICALLQLWSNPGFSQSISNTFSKAEHPNPITASPEAAALGKYGDVPVSLFSGLPDVSIPIYNFKIGDITVPIKLSYNAGGIRVDDIATNVGLGWSLNAGGVISRTQNGGPDGSANIGFPNPFNPNFPDLEGSHPDYDLGKQLVEEHIDMERDFYYYNFLNSSGKFLIDHSGKVCFFPSDPNIKVNMFENGGSIIITDDKGIKYYFDVIETSKNTPVCSVGIPGNSEYPDEIISAFYLSKIVSPNNNEIDFDYESYNYKVVKGYNEVRYEKQGILDCAELTMQNRTCNTIQEFFGKRIKRIRSSDNSSLVEFSYSASNRLDLKYNNIDQGNALEHIVVKQNGVTVKNWDLNHNYFGSGTNLRLKLLSIKEDSQPAYQFTYDEQHQLPERLSFSQDYWGFYNGKTATNTFIPPIPSIGRITGADRMPDFEYMKTYSLIGIRYPTGGITNFEFEPHKDNVTESVTNYITESATVSNTSNGSTDFFLPLNAAEFKMSWSLPTINTDDFMFGYIMGGTNFSTVYKTVSGNGFETNFPSITAGANYRLMIAGSNGDDKGDLYFEWKKPVTTTNTYSKIVFGGLRVKAIKTYDGALLTGSKFYNYNWINDPQHSSVILPTSAPDYLVFNSIYTVPKINTASGGAILEGTCGYNVISSSSSQSLGVNLDNTLGYEQVSETYEENGLNGRKIYRYLKGPIEGAKGMLAEETVQRLDGAVYKNVHSSKNTYGFPIVGRDTIPSMKISYIQPEVTVGSGDHYSKIPAQFEVQKFLFVSGKVQLQQTKEVSYSSINTDSVTTGSEYTYGNPNYSFPTIIYNTDSKGRIVRNEKQYVKDKTNIPVYLAMSNANIISPVVEERFIDQGNNQQIAQRKNNFSVFSGTYQPLSIETSYGSAAPFIEIVYNAYDGHGNLLNFSVPNGISTAYKWGYNNQYVIAQCKNATEDEFFFEGFEENGVVGNAHSGEKYYLGDYTISWNIPNGRNYIISYWYLENGLWHYIEAAYQGATVLNQGDAIDDIRIFPLDAQVTTFTYKPLIGMTSSTDAKGMTTYYEYDAFQRLKAIKDQNGNILKQTDYHYKN